MRLAYFASPYELLDVNRPGQDRHFTREGNNSNLQTDININNNYLSNQKSFFFHVVVVLVSTRWKQVLFTNNKFNGKIKCGDLPFKFG